MSSWWLENLIENSLQLFVLKLLFLNKNFLKCEHARQPFGQVFNQPALIITQRSSYVNTRMTINIRDSISVDQSSQRAIIWCTLTRCYLLCRLMEHFRGFRQLLINSSHTILPERLWYPARIRWISAVRSHLWRRGDSVQSSFQRVPSDRARKKQKAGCSSSS